MVLFPEVKRQWATLVLRLVTAFGALVVSLMALQLALVDRNILWHCFT